MIALDLLFRRLEAEPGCPGIEIPHDGGTLRVPVAGYADNVVLYLQGPDEEESYLKVLGEFSAASGLQLNLAKCTAMSLHPRGPTVEHSTMTIKPGPASQQVRYLRIMVSSAPAPSGLGRRLSGRFSSGWCLRNARQATHYNACDSFAPLSCRRYCTSLGPSALARRRPISSLRRFTDSSGPARSQRERVAGSRSTQLEVS